jgi:prepilin-type N-terminal cleavage/methylation domain-containing protein
LTNTSAGVSRHAFTLVELMVAMVIGLGLAGSTVLLLVQSATEQRSGFADTTVEEKAYTLQANITSCLRSMSANQGLTPVYSSGVNNTNGTLLGYQSVFVFYPTNGGYVTASISYNPSTGKVTYTPNVASPPQVIWMTNGTSTELTEFYITTSFNPDGSQNNSLVNVVFQMNDNGFSQQGTINNPSSIFRNFSVQMRNDN